MDSNGPENSKKSNIILIGMPGSGKSTIGPALARLLGMKFIDTDDVVYNAAGMELKDYVAEYGKQRFLELQEQAIFSLKLKDHVMATGGSVGCSPVLMEYLKQDGYAVYLKLDYTIIEQRLAPGRKLARDNGKSLKDLNEERSPLYEAGADFVVDCTNRDVESIVSEITGLIKS